MPNTTIAVWLVAVASVSVAVWQTIWLVLGTLLLLMLLLLLLHEYVCVGGCFAERNVARQDKTEQANQLQRGPKTRTKSPGRQATARLGVGG